jgi:hypothetical protein
MVNMDERKSITFTQVLWIIVVTLFIVLASPSLVPLGQVGFAMQINIGDLVYSALIGLIFGAGLGFFQWLAIRKLCPLSGHWISYTSLGFSMAWMFWYLTGYLVTLVFGSQGISLGPVAIYVSGVVTAAVLAGAQGLAATRNQVVGRKWMAYTFVAWILAWIFPMVAVEVFWRNSYVDIIGWRYELFLGIAFGLIYGVITSLALPFHLKQGKFLMA